jgi:hypothetical protein
LFPTCFILVIQIKKCDETLRKFILKKNTQEKEREKNKGPKLKFKQANSQIKKGGPPRGKGTTKK